MSSKSSSKKRLPALLTSVIKASAGLLAATWTSSQRGLDPTDGGKLEDWPTLRLRIPTLLEKRGAAQTAQPQAQSEPWAPAAEIATDVDWSAWCSVSLPHGRERTPTPEDVFKPQEKRALPVRQPGLTLRRRAAAPPLVTVRVMHPDPNDGLATLFISGPDTVTAPPVTVYRDGTVDTRRPIFYLPYPTFEPPSELNPQIVDVVQQSSAVRALEARQAALVGHSDLVQAFATDVLGLARSSRWQEAVSTALLGDWIQPLFTGQRLDDSAVAQLRADARTTHRHLVPLWRRRTRHGRVLLLDTPLDEGLTLHDLAFGITDAETPLLEYEPEDLRLAALIRALLPAERVAVLAWADPNVRSWAEAARQAGVDDPATFGERVRRKCRRLAAEFARRRALTVRPKSGQA